jgi:LysR family glycine cleavage system transcriptional activator
LQAGAARGSPRPEIRPSDLRHHKLIHADIAGHARGEEWDTWLAAAGEDVPIDAGDLDGGLHFHEPALALQAAADGLGIAMGYLEFVQDELASGRLVQPFDMSVRHPFSYYLVTSTRAAAAPELRSFMAWIREEAAVM